MDRDDNPHYMRIPRHTLRNGFRWHEDDNPIILPESQEDIL